jgi:hypothetical protein
MAIGNWLRQALPIYKAYWLMLQALWQCQKKQFEADLYQMFENLDEWRERLSKELNKLTPELIGSVSGWQFIREAVSVANI